jgi:hypothetical protein
MTCGWLNAISFLNIVKKMVSAVSIYYEVHCIETVSINTPSHTITVWDIAILSGHFFCRTTT